jgi:hypothetical protein
MPCNAPLKHIGRVNKQAQQNDSNITNNNKTRKKNASPPLFTFFFVDVDAPCMDDWD